MGVHISFLTSLMVSAALVAATTMGVLLGSGKEHPIGAHLEAAASAEAQIEANAQAELESTEGIGSKVKALAAGELNAGAEASSPMVEVSISKGAASVQVSAQPKATPVVEVQLDLPTVEAAANGSASLQATQHLEASVGASPAPQSAPAVQVSSHPSKTMTPSGPGASATVTADTKVQGSATLSSGENKVQISAPSASMEQPAASVSVGAETQASANVSAGTTPQSSPSVVLTVH